MTHASSPSSTISLTLRLQVEELDYDNERDNLLKFAALYGPGGPAARSLRRRGGGEVVTPVAVPALCSRRVLTMSWIEGVPHPDPKALNLAPTPTLTPTAHRSPLTSHLSP